MMDKRPGEARIHAVSDRLNSYRAKRDLGRTPEPGGAADASGAGDPSPPPAMPISIVWFGRDSQPFAIFASPTKSMRAPNVDPLEICGFDPDTTRERTATACDRLRTPILR